MLRRDRTTGITTLVSQTPAGAPGNGWSGVPDISDDGRFVVFESHATDLVAGPDSNGGGSDIYLFDAADGGVRRVSVTTAGEQPATGQSATPAISGTGRVVAFSSTAPLDAPPGRPARQVDRRSVFVRDLTDGVTRRISASRDRDGPNGESYYPAISGDGHRVAFVSTATNLDDDARARRQENIYLHDDRMPRLTLLSRSASGGAADGVSRYPAVSADGRYVLFSSDASNLHCTDRCGPATDLNLVMDVYRLDTVTGIAERVSGGPLARDPWWNASWGVASDGTGRVVAFSSREPIDDADLDHDDDLVRPGAARHRRRVHRNRGSAVRAALRWLLPDQPQTCQRAIRGAACRRRIAGQPAEPRRHALFIFAGSKRRPGRSRAARRDRSRCPDRERLLDGGTRRRRSRRHRRRSAGGWARTSRRRHRH